MANPRPILSRHAKERIAERHDKYLVKYKTVQEFEAACQDLLTRAEESRRHLNDQVFMAYCYEKYGYDAKFSFYVYKNALFVVIGRVVVTVLDTTKHAMTKQLTTRH